jgi:hypothetical protein
MNKFNTSIIIALTFLSSCNEGDDRASNSAKKTELMSKESSFFITDGQNNRHEIFKIMPDLFESLKAEGKLSFSDSIYNEYNINAYCTDDGKIIVQESNRFAMYPSIEILRTTLKGYAGPYKRELLEGLNPYNDNFPAEVNNIISKMLADLNLDPNLSFKHLLKRLDAIIVKNRSKAFLDKHLLGFVALIGKHNIDEFGGKWEMVLSEDKKTWNPAIKIENEELYFVNYILEDFSNSDLPYPATEVFETVRDIIRINILGEKSSDAK